MEMKISYIDAAGTFRQLFAPADLHEKAMHFLAKGGATKVFAVAA